MSHLKFAVMASLCFILTTTAISAFGKVPTDLAFRVFLNQKPIGNHLYKFESIDDGYRVVSEADYQVKILFFTAYEYEHKSVEQWARGCLEQVFSNTNDDGENYRVLMRKTRHGAVITVNFREQTLNDECVRTFAYWDRQLLDSDKLLNAQTGELESVDLAPRGESPLPWKADISADNFLLTTPEGPLQLWYDSAGTWVGLRAELNNGRVIEYRSLKNDLPVTDRTLPGTVPARNESL